MVAPFLRRSFSLWAAQLAASVALAQTPVPPLDPALPDQCKELKAFVAEPKMTLDFQAIGLIQKLVQGVELKNPKDQERLAKGLGEVFRTGKVRPSEKDILYRECADALAKLGTNGAKELERALADARHKDAIALRTHMILALGRTQDDKQVEWLVDTAVRSPHDEIRAAAGEALGSFGSLDIKGRRDAVKALIREWGSLHQLATTRDSNDPNAPIDMGPQNARRTLKVIEGKWNGTLQKLTGMSHTAFEDWQRWLNKNPGWTSTGGMKKP